MKWQDRISDRIKGLVNIDNVALEFERRIKKNEAKMPKNYAATKARQAMLALLKEKGVHTSEAVSLLHYTEKEPYSGCGCCEHRNRY